MRIVLKSLLIFFLSLNTFGSTNQDIVFQSRWDLPNPDFIKKKESPWPGAEQIYQTIHRKEVELQFDSFKVTTLGYGASTPKVISLDLAKHTVLDHRNEGEAGPCLAGSFFPGSFSAQFPLKELVTIELRNRYDINRERGVCQVILEEIVTVEIDGKEFSHHLSQDMGHRLISDCLISE